MKSVPMPNLPSRPILLVNPWIHDFSAYDLWMKPLGLLYLGSILRSQGFEVTLLDCVGFHSLPESFTKDLPLPKSRAFGRSHFFKEVIPKPRALKNIPRNFRRYGLPPGVVKNYLASLPRPGLILVTSLMTYWHSGVAETIDFLRRNIPETPIFLGGIYATLCTEHAQIHSGADRVLAGPWDVEKGRIICGGVRSPDRLGGGGLCRLALPGFRSLSPAGLRLPADPLAVAPLAARIAPLRNLRKESKSGLPRASSGKSSIGAGNSASKILLFTMTPCCWIPPPTSNPSSGR